MLPRAAQSLQLPVVFEICHLFFFDCVYSQVTEIRERKAAVKEELLSISSKFINSKEKVINNAL